MNKHGLCMLVFDVWSMWSTALCLDVCFRKTGLFIPVSKLQGFLLEKKSPQTSFGPYLWYINRLWYCFSNICIYIVTHFWPRRWFGVCFWRNPEIFEAFRPWQRGQPNTIGPPKWLVTVVKQKQYTIPDSHLGGHFTSSQLGVYQVGTVSY